jgi:DNA primase
MTNLSDLRRTVNLADLAVQAGSTLRRTGNGWYAGPCPFCGGTDRFVVHDTGNGWRWMCRVCGDGRYHDAIDFYERWQSVSFKQAVADLGGLPLAASTPATQAPAYSTHTPADLQDAAREVIAQGIKALWADTGARARAWLNGRGLSDETLQRWQIGYVPGEPSEWRGIAGLRVPCGILIPGIVGGAVWYLKVRRAMGKPKYLAVKSLAVPALFGADTLAGHTVAVMTEGEFDAMLLHQAAGDLCGVMTLGSQSAGLDVPTWAGYLLPIARLLVAYDVDTAGDTGAARVTRITKRAQRVAVPVLREGDKDVSDYWKHGGDLRAWVSGLIGADDDDALMDAVLAWAETKGYAPTFGPQGQVVMRRD